jgi:hypothetical protein
MINRVEVIERGVGRHYTNYEVKDAWIDIQDNGETIKVFINEPSPYENGKPINTDASIS